MMRNQVGRRIQIRSRSTSLALQLKEQLISFQQQGGLGI